MIRRLLNAAILGLAAIPLGATGAEPPVTHQDVTRNWADAWNGHDITKVLALFAKDIEIDQPENNRPLDYEGARKFFSMIFKAYPDFHVTVVQAIVDGRSAVSVERVTGTWTGPFVNPSTGKATPGNGRHFDHPVPWSYSTTRTAKFGTSRSTGISSPLTGNSG